MNDPYERDLEAVKTPLLHKGPKTRRLRQKALFPLFKSIASNHQIM